MGRRVQGDTESRIGRAPAEGFADLGALHWGQTWALSSALKGRGNESYVREGGWHMHHEVWDPRGPEGLRHRPPPCGGSCYTKHPLVLERKRGVC